jgi:hypothetical protein
MDEGVSVLAQVCARLRSGDRDGAIGSLAGGYPFTQPKNSGRRYTPRQMTTQFLADGFIDRFSGTRLLFPAVLRVLSSELPTEFPFHPNWQMSATHPAYWELFRPTIM